MKAKCRMPPYGALCMLCATQCPPPPCIPPDALVFDYENMLEPGFSVSSQQKNVREEFKCRIMQSSMPIGALLLAKLIIKTRQIMRKRKSQHLWFSWRDFHWWSPNCTNGQLDTFRWVHQFNLGFFLIWGQLLIENACRGAHIYAFSFEKVRERIICKTGGREVVFCSQPKPKPKYHILEFHLDLLTTNPL